MNRSEKGGIRRRKQDTEIDDMISSVNYVADTPEIDLTEDISTSINFIRDMYHQGKSMIIDLMNIKPDNPFYIENNE